MFKIRAPYETIDWQNLQVPDQLLLCDHIQGFDVALENPILRFLDSQALQTDRRIKVIYNHYVGPEVQSIYPHLDIKIDVDRLIAKNFLALKHYHTHDPHDFRHFVCSFNGSVHIGRKLLTAILHRWKWFDAATCTKNFTYTRAELDGHIRDLVAPERESFFRKWFFAADSDDFFQSIVGTYDPRRQEDHAWNFHHLQSCLTTSFVHLVSETLPTSHYAFVTEKFLYSVVTRGIFLAYAQPRWHERVSACFGFKKFDRIFDYGFDVIHNPVERLIQLTTMLSKFSVLDPQDWQDLYALEHDTVEFNRDHYMSGDYEKCVRDYCKPNMLLS